VPALLLGVEFPTVDASINRRDFAYRTRWNQAYYRLERGF
jgi:hypothetical protein